MKIYEFMVNIQFFEKPSRYEIRAVTSIYYQLLVEVAHVIGKLSMIFFKLLSSIIYIDYDVAYSFLYNFQIHTKKAKFFKSQKEIVSHIYKITYNLSQNLTMISRHYGPYSLTIILYVQNDHSSRLSFSRSIDLAMFSTKFLFLREL